MRRICDTNILLFDALQPGRLSDRSREALDGGEAESSLACSDVSLWEVATLIRKGRIQVAKDTRTFLWGLVAARRITVLPVNIEIAALSQSSLFAHEDPADRLIAATALHHRAPLITADKRLQAIEALHTVW